MFRYASNHRAEQLNQELQVWRDWDPAEHMYWLAFEAEARIQIRPRQHFIAQHLMRSPGDIMQLNMGEGKTRVVIPMLVLYWSFSQQSKNITRLTFLSALIHEAFDYLHATLCASALGRKLFLIPFERQVETTLSGVLAIKQTLLYCQAVKGMVIVAPEHRLSLQLKLLELGTDDASEPVCRVLEEIAAMPFTDLLDESDEVLHHRYQLIYAVGDRVKLPSDAQRWLAVQALLRVVKCVKHNHAFTSILADQRICVRSPDTNEAFGTFRLLRGGALDSITPSFLRHLVDGLIENPPPELWWLSSFAHGKELEELRRAMCDPRVALNDLALGDLPELWRDSVLAIRGLFAGGIFLHCLLKRHRVDFGVARPGGQKRLAVPFRAADTPAARAEFAHPDCALLFTHLAYYEDGLSQGEFRGALTKLLSLGPNAQQSIYCRWFEQSKPRMSPEDLASLDHTTKLDPTNTQQFQTLLDYFRLNFECINFWLEHCMLPFETQQYEHRIMASPWHLNNHGNECGQVVGFSGTNDNYRLLPLHVRQQMLADETSEIARELRGTNGKMLTVILENTQGVEELPHSPKPTWQSVLDLCIKLEVDGLIDSGGLMAGKSNQDAAMWLLDQLAGTFLGVVFFSSRTKQWTILDRESRRHPRDSSPIQERDCFAYVNLFRASETVPSTPR